MRFVAPSIFLVGAIALHGETIQERISAYVRSYADAGLFSGVVLVSKGNAVVYQQAFGLADRALKVPNTVQSKFYIASLSKPITAVGVLRLVEQGKLSLDDHLSKFVPDFPGGDKITIEELLTHYSGLADASADPDYNNWSRFPQTPAALVERVKKKSPESKAGTHYFYSNSNYHILALIIEKQSGQSYGEFLAKEIFQPLSMSDTPIRRLTAQSFNISCTVTTQQERLISKTRHISIGPAKPATAHSIPPRKISCVFIARCKMGSCSGPRRCVHRMDSMEKIATSECFGFVDNALVIAASSSMEVVPDSRRTSNDSSMMTPP